MTSQWRGLRGQLALPEDCLLLSRGLALRLGEANGVQLPLAEIALHHRVHMAPPFEHWYERRQAAAPRRGAPVTPTRFKLNTDAWI